MQFTHLRHRCAKESKRNKRIDRGCQRYQDTKTEETFCIILSKEAALWARSFIIFSEDTEKSMASMETEGMAGIASGPRVGSSDCRSGDFAGSGDVF